MDKLLVKLREWMNGDPVVRTATVGVGYCGLMVTISISDRITRTEMFAWRDVDGGSFDIVAVRLACMLCAIESEWGEWRARPPRAWQIRSEDFVASMGISPDLASGKPSNAAAAKMEQYPVGLRDEDVACIICKRFPCSCSVTCVVCQRSPCSCDLPKPEYHEAK